MEVHTKVRCKNKNDYMEYMQAYTVTILNYVHFMGVDVCISKK